MALGDPSAPVFELRPGPVPDAEVDVLTTWHRTRLGPAALPMVIDWLERWLEATGNPQGATRANSEDEIVLWTASGIAQEKGVNRRTVYEWIDRPDFPEPFAKPIGGGPVWEPAKVEAWLLSGARRRSR